MSATSPPLEATLAHASALDPLLGAEIGPLEADWFPASALHDAGSAALAEGLAHIVRRYPRAARRVSGSFFVGEYTWYLLGAAAVAFLAEGRAPDLAPEGVALRYSTYIWSEGDASGEAERLDVRFLSGRFAGLPGDPAASHPDCLPLPNAAALRDWLRAGLEAHLAPLVAAVSAQTRLGARAQWNLVADAAAAVFLHAGQRLGGPERAQSEGLAFVKAPASPLRNPGTGYVTIEAGDRCESFRTRGGCCLFYKLDPGNNCTACVLRPAAERNERLRAYVAGKHT
ncbi:MAG TPA: ferric iron reductase [Roseiflexaceae bacterium]|nr:ferric iron reductase [Roseiflexaceae bacterium]